MKLGVLLIALGCFGAVVGILNHHSILCSGGIVVLVCGVLRIRMIRGKARASPEGPESKAQ